MKKRRKKKKEGRKSLGGGFVGFSGRLTTPTNNIGVERAF